MNGPAIKVLNLDKNFGDVHAVRGVSFDLQPGEIFSLLGPNGAGKTTTIGMISGLLTPDAGDVWLMGHSIQQDAEAAKAQLGVVPQEIALYEDISARANLPEGQRTEQPGGRRASAHRAGRSRHRRGFQIFGRDETPPQCRCGPAASPQNTHHG